MPDHETRIRELGAEIERLRDRIAKAGSDLEAEYRLRAYAEREKEQAQQALTTLRSKVEEVVARAQAKRIDAVFVGRLQAILDETTPEERS